MNLKKYSMILLLVLFYSCGDDFNDIDKRDDNAVKITDSYPRSCQNPVFSPDGQYIIYTRFLNGYNLSPSEIVKIKIDGSEERILVSSANSGNVNVPFGSWVDDRICFASDRAGMADEIWIVNDDGSNLRQITTHSDNEGVYYIEPVFNPQNNDQIVFEYVEGENDITAIHKIAYLDVITGEIKLITDGSFDDRLPSWSNDGSKILFQRNKYGQDEGWSIYIADIDFSKAECLQNIKELSSGISDNTDCSWSYNDKYILSSSNYGDLEVPNIWLFPLDYTLSPVRKTFNKLYEDGAPSQSHDGKMIAFESHYGETEEQSSEIWIIKQ